MVLLYLQLFVGGLMSYLHYLCLFTYSGVQHILCCVPLVVCRRAHVLFTLFAVCLRIVVSNTYCVFVFVLFVFVYVANFSGLSFFYCLFGILQRLFSRLIVLIGCWNWYNFGDVIFNSIMANFLMYWWLFLFSNGILWYLIFFLI